MLSVAIVFLRCEFLRVRFCKRSLYNGSFLNQQKLFNCRTRRKGDWKKMGGNYIRNLNSYALILNSVKWNVGMALVLLGKHCVASFLHKLALLWLTSVKLSIWMWWWALNTGLCSSLEKSICVYLIADWGSRWVIRIRIWIEMEHNLLCWRSSRCADVDRVAWNKNDTTALVDFV